MKFLSKTAFCLLSFHVAHVEQVRCFVPSVVQVAAFVVVQLPKEWPGAVIVFVSLAPHFEQVRCCVPFEVQVQNQVLQVYTNLRFLPFV